MTSSDIFMGLRFDAERWSDAIYRAWLSTTRIGVVWVCGYDPQRLLPDLRGTDAWYQGQARMTVIEFNDFHKALIADIYRSTGIADIGGVIDFEKAGRRKLAPDFTGLYDEIDLMQPRAPTFEHKVAIIPVGLDFGLLEARVLALAAHESVRGIVLDLESSVGEIRPTRDYVRMLVGYSPERLEPRFEPKKPLVKQNGRSASYLQHDPTKSPKRRRR